MLDHSGQGQGLYETLQHSLVRTLASRTTPSVCPSPTLLTTVSRAHRRDSFPPWANSEPQCLFPPQPQREHAAQPPPAQRPPPPTGAH